MLVLVQKMLELSMRLEGSDRAILRILGKMIGVFPVHYSRWLQRRLFRGTWDPVKRYRKQEREQSSCNEDAGEDPDKAD